MEEAAVPDWLNEAFLSTSLQGGEKSKDNILVKKFTASLAAPAGNNYGSYVLRVKLKLTRKGTNKEDTLSLIIKSPVTNKNEQFNEMIKEFRDVESIFYYQFLPTARKFCDCNFAPKDFYSSVPSVVVLEDLKENGFLMADRLKQLDLDHCLLYAVAAAHFHAVSVAVHKVNPALVETIGVDKMFSGDSQCSKMFEDMLPDGLECLAKYMDKTTEFKKYSNLTRKFFSRLWPLIVEISKTNKTLKVLNQGDPWVTNMMFRYGSEGNVCEMKLIDFQALKFGSSLHDIMFFFWCGANNDVREHGYEEFFHLYCNTLNTKLQELGCPERLTYNELMEEVKNYTPVSLLFIVNCIPSLLNEESIDFDNLIGEEVDGTGKRVNKLAKCFTDKYCETYLHRHIKQVESLGGFDFLANIII